MNIYHNPNNNYRKIVERIEKKQQNKRKLQPDV